MDYRQFLFILSWDCILTPTGPQAACLILNQDAFGKSYLKPLQPTLKGKSESKILKTKNKCTTYEKWEQIISAAHQVPNSEPILLLIFHHGLPGGTLACGLTPGVSSSDVSGRTIWNDIKKLSQTHPVGVINNACYSGDLLKEQLYDNLSDPKSLESTPCLLLGSAPGRTSYEFDLPTILSQASSTDSLETIFEKSSELDIISSGPWSSLGLDASI